MRQPRTDADTDTLIAYVVADCTTRRQLAKLERDALRRRETWVAELCERMPRRQVSQLLQAALLDAGFTEDELTRHGVRYGGVRRAAEKHRPANS